MKIPVTLLKAAIERHNERARTRQEVLLAEAYDKYLESLGAAPLAREATKLSEKVCDLQRRVLSAGLSLNGLSANADIDEPVCALNWQEKNEWTNKEREKLRKKDPACRETTIETVLLAAAAAGTDDVAAFLDGLKLNWRDEA